MRVNGPSGSGGMKEPFRGRVRFTFLSNRSAGHELPPRRGQPVAVIGAGVAGLVAAYELEQLGHPVVVLEGSHRAGGRIYSYRFAGPPADSPIAELGAMRFPARHMHTMAYVARLGLSEELRPFKSLLADDNALHGTTDGYLRLRDAPRTLMDELRRALHPRDYHDATLLFAAQLSLIVDAIAPPSQREGLRHDLHSCLLDRVEEIDLRAYVRGHGETGIDLHGVFAHHPHLRGACGGDLNTFLDDILTETSAELLRVRDGMARITDRLARRLHRPILFGHEVVGMAVQDDGVVLTVRPLGRTVTRRYGIVVCTAPLPVLRRMRLSGFASDKLDVIHGVKYVPATKVAFHCREAFWEREGISGGASFSGGRIRQTYYPAIDGDRALGAVLLASYTIGDEAEEWGQLPAGQRHEAVLAELSRMHPQLRSPGMVRGAVSLAWSRNKWSGSGCSVRWGKTLAEQEEERLAVARPVGPLFFAGEHCSTAPAWIDGAIQSAVEAVGQIVMRNSRSREATRPALTGVPEA